MKGDARLLVAMFHSAHVQMDGVLRRPDLWQRNY